MTRLVLYTALVFGCCATLLPAKLSACLTLPPDERYYLTFFDPAIYGDTTFRVAYLDARWLSPSRWEYDALPAVQKYATNLREWQQFAGNTPSLADVAKIVYEVPEKGLAQLVRNGPNARFAAQQFVFEGPTTTSRGQRSLALPVVGQAN